MNEKPLEQWGASDRYERYVGRWSRLVAREFLAWLALSARKRWVDVGCGTGGLTAAILAAYAPLEVFGVDRAEGFIAGARGAIADPRAHFEVGDALALPVESGTFDVAVSGLVLNFVPDHKAMVAEMVRVTKAGGTVAAYVWDYAGGMEMIRSFWDAAIVISADAARLDQGERFPICQPQPLHDLWALVGLRDVAVRPLDIVMIFEDFDDYWTPFLGKQGAAPTFLASIDEATREGIRAELQRRLIPRAAGKIVLNARAWAVQGRV